MRARPSTTGTEAGVPGKPTPGSAPGTKVVVLEGGPPEWAGTIAGIAKTCERLERWDHTADLALVWEPTGDVREVEIEHEYNTGKAVKKHTAEVWRCCGYRVDTL
jgi:hypothetical protein